MDIFQLLLETFEDCKCHHLAGANILGLNRNPARLLPTAKLPMGISIRLHRCLGLSHLYVTNHSSLVKIWTVTMGGKRNEELVITGREAQQVCISPAPRNSEPAWCI